MKRMKLLVIFMIFLLQYTTATAQIVEKKSAKASTDSAAQLAAFRQLFWDSLPTPYSWTNDYAWLFSTAQRNYLDSIMADFEKKTTAEICIVTLDTYCTAIENFDALALHIAKTWGVGKKDKNNGILICISPGYRKIRICNGYGIEKLLTDEETKAIIENVIIHHYKNGDYFAGTRNGLQAIMVKLGDKLKAD